jgi:tetratricopeptide (TPR) repeat protein
LEHLVNSSLVTQRVGGDAQPRFGMLETIRDFAAEQLGARGEGSSVRLAHLGYSLDLARRYELLLEGSDQLRWLDVMEAELGNIRQALAWALDPATVPSDVPERTDRVTKATQLTVAAEALFSLRGRPAEASGWARQCLRWVDPLAEGVAGPAMGTLPLALPALLVAHAQRVLASDPLLKPGTSQRLLEASISTCETLGDHVGIAQASMYLYWAWGKESGDSEKLRQALERAVAIARTVGRPRLLGECLNLIAYQSLKDGHFLRSLAEGQEALAVLTEAGDRLQIGSVYLHLSNAYRWSGNDQAGIDYAEKARGYATHLSDPLWWMSRVFLVRIYIGIGKFESAAGLLEECERQSRRFGDPVRMSALEVFRGDLARGLGDLGLAREHYARVRDIGRDNQSLSMAHLTMMEGHPLIAAQHLCRAIRRAMEISSLYMYVLNEALTCLAPADPVAALRIGGQAAAFSAAGRGNPSYTFDQVRADDALVLARSLISPEIGSQAWEAGKLLPIEEALTEAGVSLASMTVG